MLLAIFLLYLSGVPFIQCKQLHEYMTPGEVMSVFHTLPHLVPKYEVVPVLRRLKKKLGAKHEDNTSEIELKAFNESVRLYLNPTEGILATEDTPVWTVTSDSEAPEGLLYKQVPSAMKYMGIPLQDVYTSSAVVLTPTPDGQVHLDGVLNNSLVIKSLPPRILKEVAYGGHNLYEPHHMKNITNDDGFAHTHHHVVYKMSPSNQYNDFKITDPKNHRAKRNAPDVIYPEFIIVIDYRLYNLLGGSIEKALRYLLSFWNGVDLRYRLLTTPKIRLHIAAIIIALDNDATPYLEKSHFEESSVDADLALRAMADYFYREDRFPTDFYDIAITLTTLDLCNMITDDFCDTSTLGYAYVAGACDRNATKHSSEAVGIVEDKGGFDGIIPTAHEIGHLIGARHDGNPKGAADCPPFDGFIMTSGLMLHENGFEWSSCSINAFHDFINEDRAKCLYNEPILGKQVPRTLPGKLMSLDEQCKRVFGTLACNKDATVCTRLECEFPGFEGSGFCKAVAPAAEGSPCGDGLFCLNGKCVLEGMVKDPKKKYIPKFIVQKIKEIPWISNLLKRLKKRLNIFKN
ncbi:A disintegrin and metalloproteinase with thrombospondin motifs 1 [Camponotus floridanus]|uniref:A disintegrin and metalloproteinase with thrombospondin motifs 1 n=1 Tax=Camponotus floridanus TaxID=104421 RepID=E2AEB8_CAMFO|nr:A disintegrin and metalloproteinase with thrombospondin motifs 1 [Camponotus floridanus]EFN68351.1 A disintegrin and metalloproteinase with thrombospondin motifs 1 [Camponotus floridanus]